MKPLLMCMRPRHIPECIEAFESLPIDKVWFEYMTEAGIVEEMPAVVVEAKARGYTHALLLSDDTVPTPEALAAVLEYAPHFKCATGYCNLDSTLPFVNLTKRPFRNLEQSVGNDFAFYTRAEVDAHPNDLVPTFFAGACLTCMPIELWERYPFQVLGGPGHPGYSSDWCLSTRLYKDGVQIVGVKGAFVRHVKEVWGKRDLDPSKRLLIGERPAGVRWDAR